MRLLLDAHVSGRRVGRALRARGHEVASADEDESLRTLDDEGLLRVAANSRRIMVTFDVKDYPRIHRDWAHAGKHHSGCMVLTGIDHSHFGDILRAIDSALAARTEPECWWDLLLFVTRD